MLQRHAAPSRAMGQREKIGYRRVLSLTLPKLSASMRGKFKHVAEKAVGLLKGTTVSESRILLSQCTNCDCKLQVKTHSKEKVITCPKCNVQITINATIAGTKDLPHEVAPAKTLKTSVIPCPNCGSELEIGRKSYGKNMICRECEQTVFIPNPLKQSPTDDDESDINREGGNLSTGDWLVCIFLPCVGIIAGLVRLTQGKMGGPEMLGFSVLSSFIWLIFNGVIAVITQR